MSRRAFQCWALLRPNKNKQNLIKNKTFLFLKIVVKSDVFNVVT